MDIKIGEEQYKYRLIGCPINIPRASDYGITQNDITEKYQYDKQYEEYSTKAQNFCDNITFVMGYILLLCEIVYYFFFSGKIHFHLPFTNNIYNIFALAGYVLLFFWLGFFPAGAQGQILRLIIPDKTFRAFAHLFYKEPQIPSKFPMVESYMNAYKDFITNKAPKLKKEYNGIEKYNYNTTLFGYNTLNELASEIIRYTDSYNEKITQENHRKEQKYWFELDPYEFEKEVANWFSEQGYEAKVTKKSGDEGVDVIITKNNYIGYVQCKRYTNSKVDRPTLNALYGVVCANKATQGIIVCLQGVTAEAKDFAKKTNIRIITVDELAPNEDLFFHKEIKQTISNVPIKCNEYWCKIGYIILNTNCYHEETDAIKTIDKWQNSLNHAIQYNGLYY